MVEETVVKLNKPIPLFLEWVLMLDKDKVDMLNNHNKVNLQFNRMLKTNTLNNNNNSNQINTKANLPFNLMVNKINTLRVYRWRLRMVAVWQEVRSVVLVRDKVKTFGRNFNRRMRV